MSCDRLFDQREIFGLDLFDDVIDDEDFVIGQIGLQRRA